MNSAVTADSPYSVSWRPAFGAADGAPIDHVLIRRLDDGSGGPGGPGGPGEDTAPVAELPAIDPDGAGALLERVETSLKGSAREFEDRWGIGEALRADPGPELGWVPEKHHRPDRRSAGLRQLDVLRPAGRVRVRPGGSGEPGSASCVGAGVVGAA